MSGGYLNGTRDPPPWFGAERFLEFKVSSDAFGYAAMLFQSLTVV